MEKLYPWETIKGPENEKIPRYQLQTFLEGADPIPSPFLPYAAPPMGAKGVTLVTNQWTR